MIFLSYFTSWTIIGIFKQNYCRKCVFNLIQVNFIMASVGMASEIRSSQFEFILLETVNYERKIHVSRSLNSFLTMVALMTINTCKKIMSLVGKAKIECLNIYVDMWVWFITWIFNNLREISYLPFYIGPCPLTSLKFFEYGTSFLTDSLHTIYAGVFKKLLSLYFDPKYRREQWSLFKIIFTVDQHLSLIKIPSTIQRRFRSLNLLKKFKGSEYRCLFHFGLTSITNFVHTTAERNMLLSLITAINLASSDTVSNDNFEYIDELLKHFVEQFQ